MSKFGTFGEYPKDSLASAEKALLTAWRSLERYHDDLVLERAVLALHAHQIKEPVEYTHLRKRGRRGQEPSDGG